METKTSCCGPHVSLEKTLLETVKKHTGTSEQCTCVQCFLGSPTQYVIRKFSEEDLRNTGDYIREKNRKLYVHAPYIINLARESDEPIVAKGSTTLSNILTTLGRVDPERTGTVLHIGAKGT
jgi:endonuclease IV